jgi:hypothetical protein
MKIDWSRVLYCHPQRFGAIWSARSACSQVMLWFYAHCGWLEEATKIDFFPHHYRTGVMNRNPIYKEWRKLCQLEETPFVRVIRDPYKRAVSSYHSAVKRPSICRSDISKFLGRPISDKNGFSFREYLNFAESLDVANCNMHIREQFNHFEEQVHPSFIINVDAQDLYGGLNQFEEKFGLPHADFKSGLLKVATEELGRRHHTKRFETPDDFSEVRLGRAGVRRLWPSYESLLNAQTRAQIQRIYRKDFAAYRDHLGAGASNTALRANAQPTVLARETRTN